MEKHKYALICEKTAWAKRKVLDMCVHSGKGHLTSAYSCAEILAVLYYDIMRVDPSNPEWFDRDRLIISKNHASVMQYPILADLGYFNVSELDTFCDDGTRLGTHGKFSLEGIDFAGGSLGIGLGVASGLAYGLKASDNPAKVFCLVGDGECYEGAIWEAAMFAGSNRLDNLVVILDRNRMSVLGFTEDLLNLDPFTAKWQAFGFDTIEVDGHSITELHEELSCIGNRKSDKPLLICANTIKGKGISFLENELFRHGLAPKPYEIDAAYACLESEGVR